MFLLSLVAGWSAQSARTVAPSRARAACCDLPMPASLREFIADSQQEFIDGLVLPADDAPPEEVVRACMDGLQHNDEPRADSGKLLCWATAGDMMRTIHGGDPAKFVRWTRRSPVFDCMVGCERFEIEADTVLLLPGTPTRGAMAKAVVLVAPTEAIVDGAHSVRGRIGAPPERRFLWTMQQQRRPPRVGAWLIYEVLAIDHAFALTE